VAPILSVVVPAGAAVAFGIALQVGYEVAYSQNLLVIKEGIDSTGAYIDSATDFNHNYSDIINSKGYWNNLMPMYYGGYWK